MRLNRGWIYIGLLSVVFIILGQNFDLVPENKLLKPMSDRYLESLPENLNRKSFFERNILRGPASLSVDGSDLTYDKMAKKALQMGAENLRQSDDFQQSDIGRFVREIEKKAQAKVRLWTRWMREDTNNESHSSDAVHSSVDVVASPNYAGLKLKSTDVETSCGYSVQNRSMDVLFGSATSSSSFGMGYAPQDQSSTLKMQLNW